MLPITNAFEVKHHQPAAVTVLPAAVTSPAAVVVSPTASQKKILILEGAWRSASASPQKLTIFNLMRTTRFCGCRKPSFPAASKKGQR
jgi:hypothetical protein